MIEILDVEQMDLVAAGDGDPGLGIADEIPRLWDEILKRLYSDVNAG